MEFRVLGPLEVVTGDRASAPPGTKERTILARLLADPARPVATDALIDAAWPDAPHESAERSLHVRIAGLRSFLEPDRRRGAASNLLVRDGAAYRLAIDPMQIDAVRFERLVTRAAAAEGDAAIAACDEALALWRGRPYSELPDAQFAAAEARRLEDLHSRACLLRARALVETGRHDEAVPELERLVDAQPHDEEPARLLATAHYRAGRQVEALDALRALGRRLIDLGLEPSPATRELEAGILGHAVDPVTAPPRRPLTRRPPASSFVGRLGLLAHAAELIDSHALVSVVGVGGAGKTRLALELIAERPGDAWWCELAPLRSDADVAGAIAESVGVESTGGGTALERTVAQLADSRGLLVLDNCEQVVDGVAALVEELLAGCPELRVLATTRVPIGVDGEHVMRVTGLDLQTGGAATRLFVDRARAAGCADDPAAHPELVAEICRRLDGLPLAIELAAGRTRSMTLADIDDRLDRRLALLKLTGRRANRRHSTLREAIDWSYDLLDEPQRRVFERLSVFFGGATLAAAEDVCSGGEVAREDVADLLDSLVANSLVTAVPRAGRMIYKLLETLREYATLRAEERGETNELRDRHADHFVDLIDETIDDALRGPRMPLIETFDDVREAVRWCMESDAEPDRAFVIAEALTFPALAAHAEEIAKLMIEVIVRWPGPHRLRYRMLGAASATTLMVGDSDRAHELAEQALALEPESSMPALLARRTQAQLAYFSGDPVAQVAWAEMSRLARAAGNDLLACEADGFTVQVMVATGQHDRAISAAAEVRAEAERMNSRVLISWGKYVTGMALLSRDPAEARGWFEGALELGHQGNYSHMERFSLRALGTAALLEGDLPRAAESLLAALAIGESHAEAATQRATLMNVAVLVAQCDRYQDAAALFAATDGWPAAPSLAKVARRARGHVEQALTPDQLAEATAYGRRLDLEGAKAHAREVLSCQATIWASECGPGACC